MAFEEIKAKLGLDVTDFERGVAKVQGSLKSVVGSATKKFTDFKSVGQTLATAIGLNLGSISEGLARMVIGFSKQQEEALLSLAERSKNAADQITAQATQIRTGGDPQKRIDLLDKELISVQEQAKARKKLTDKEKQDIVKKSVLDKILGRGPLITYDELTAAEEEYTKSQAEAQARIGKIREERLSAKIELDNAATKKETANIDSVTKNINDAENERVKGLEIQMTEQELLLKLKEDFIKAEKDSNNTAKTALEQSAALLKSEQIKTVIIQKQKNIAENADKAAQDAADKEKLKTAELEKQTGELRKQIQIKQDDINKSRRQAELPTMADVISGKRNIGGFGKSSASKLEKARAKALELSDAEQRAREAYAGATTGGAKDAALAQGRGIRARLDQTRGQIGSMEKLLGSRVSDANPYAAMEKELALVKDELVTLNTITLASTSAK